MDFDSSLRESGFIATSDFWNFRLFCALLISLVNFGFQLIS